MTTHAMRSISKQFRTVRDSAAYAHSTRRGLSVSAVFVATILFALEVHGQPQPLIAVLTGPQPDFLECVLFDEGPGIHTVYVVHQFNVGATAVRFKLAQTPGMTMTYLSETHPFASTSGSTQSGISVCYGSCTPGDQIVATVSYMSYGTSSPCSQILAVPHPAAQTVEGIRCEGAPFVMFVEDLWVSTLAGACGGCPATSHGFPGSPQTFDCNPVSVASTTWGAIKALYRH